MKRPIDRGDTDCEWRVVLISRGQAFAWGKGRRVCLLGIAALALSILQGQARAEVQVDAAEGWTSIAASELPGGLRRRLGVIESQDDIVLARLGAVAISLLESGWVADSLALRDGEIKLAGLRQRQAVFAGSSGEMPVSPPWSEGEIIGAPTRVVRETRDWLAELDRRGFPFAQVWLKPAAEREDGAFEAALLLGPSGGLGGIRLHGAERLRESFLASYMGLDRSRPFSLYEARRGRDRLRFLSRSSASSFRPSTA